MRTVEWPEVTDVSDGVVIRTEGLTKTYPTGVTAVDGLDLAVSEGEIFGYSARTARARPPPSAC